MNYMLDHSFFDNLSSLLLSINTDDYNLFLPSLIAFPMKLLGSTFTKYVLTCFLMFLVPTFFIQGLIVTKMINNDAFTKGNLFVIAFALSVCFAGNYYALFRGFIDIAFLVPMSASMYLFIDYDFSKMSIARNSAIALMLIIAWICRRYAIFFLIGYVMAMLIKAFFSTSIIQTQKIYLVSQLIFCK